MVPRIIKIFIVFVLSTVFFFKYSAYSQDNTLYNMSLYQAVGENPAFQPKCRVMIGLPGISNLSFDFAHTGFTWNDVIKKGTGRQKDSLVIDFNSLENSMAPVNYIKSDIQVSLFSLGLWVQDFYVSYDVTNKTFARFNYPKGIVSIKNGNGAYLGDNDPLTFKGLGASITNYTEWSLGASKNILQGLTVGAKLKYLWGTADFTTNNSDIRIITDPDLNYVKVAVDADLRASFPAEIVRDPKTKEITDLEMKMPDDPSTSDIRKNFIYNGNRGFGVDLGATYELGHYFLFSASLIDLGYIKWKSNTYSLKKSGSYTFTGINLPGINSTIKWDSLFSDIADSLETFAKDFKDMNSSYKTALNTKIFLGANFIVNDHINFGIHSRGYFYDKTIHPSLTLSVNTNPVRWFGFSVNYSMMNRSYSNIGVGWALKLGFLQWFFMSDNVKGVFHPKDTKTATFHTGFNLLFGCKQKLDYGLID